MKKMIALICAAAMTTSCAAASVGALEARRGASLKILHRVNELNVKMDDYNESLDCITRNNYEVYAEYRDDRTYKYENNKNIQAAIKYIKGKIDYFVDCFNDLASDKKLIVGNDDRIIDKIGKIIDSMQGDIDDFVRKAKNISVDENKDKVFYTETVENMNIDEDKDNGDRKELTPKQVEDLFKKTVSGLDDKIKSVNNLVEDYDEQSEGYDEQNEIDDEQSEFDEEYEKALEKIDPALATTFEELLANFKTKFREVIEKKGRGRFPKRVADAIRGVTGDNIILDGKVGIKQKLQHIASDESAKEAVKLMDDAISKMEVYIISLPSEGEKLAVSNMTIDDALTHIEEYLNLVDNDKYKYKEIKDNKEIDNRDLLFSLPEYKKGNKNFNLAIQKLKPKASMKKLEELRLELMALYMDDDLSEHDRAQQIGNTVQKAREKLQEIRNKINQNNQNQG